jgi:hypothetical protein
VLKSDDPDAAVNLLSELPFIAPVVHAIRLFLFLLLFALGHVQEVDEVPVDRLEAQVLVEEAELVRLEAGVTVAHLATDPSKVRLVRVERQNLALGDDSRTVSETKKRCVSIYTST